MWFCSFGLNISNELITSFLSVFMSENVSCVFCFLHCYLNRHLHWRWRWRWREILSVRVHPYLWTREGGAKTPYLGRQLK